MPLPGSISRACAGAAPAGCRADRETAARLSRTAPAPTAPGRTESPDRCSAASRSNVPAGRPAILAVAPGGRQHVGRRLFDARVLLLPAQPQRERQVARADEHDVDAGRRGNRVDVFERRGLLDDHDDEDVAIGGVVVAVGIRPGGGRQARARSAPAGRRIAAGVGRLPRQRRRADERKDHAVHAGVEHALGASTPRSPARARTAPRADRASRARCCGRSRASAASAPAPARGNGSRRSPPAPRCRGCAVVIVQPKTGCDSRSRRLTGFSHGAVHHFLISQTSAIWLPRPALPSPGGALKVSVSVAAARGLDRHVELHRLDRRRLLDRRVDLVLVVGDQPDRACSC